MEFCKDRVFTALNADELRAGDKVIVGDILANIKENVKQGKFIRPLYMVEDECNSCRFVIKDDDYDLNRETINFALAYLVERKENCTNCGEYEDCGFVQNQSRFANLNRCEYWKPKTEQKAEKHYRPFRDTDELLKVWEKKAGEWGDTLWMPYIWVREKGCEKSAGLITCYGSKGITVRGKGMYFDTLFTMFEFLDGSPCGVEE